MEKTGELKVGTSYCDLCGKPAAAIYNDRALCDEHAELKLKTASVDDGLSLKCGSSALSERHVKP